MQPVFLQHTFKSHFNVFIQLLEDSRTLFNFSTSTFCKRVISADSPGAMYKKSKENVQNLHLSLLKAWKELFNVLKCFHHQSNSLWLDLKYISISESQRLIYSKKQSRGFHYHINRHGFLGTINVSIGNKILKRGTEGCVCQIRLFLWWWRERRCFNDISGGWRIEDEISLFFNLKVFPYVTKMDVTMLFRFMYVFSFKNIFHLDVYPHEYSWTQVAVFIYVQFIGCT